MDKLDLIELEDIRSFCRLGVYDEERASGQEIKVDLSLELDLSKAALSDDLEDTVNYADISTIVQETAQAKEYFLIEHLAHETISKVFKHSEFIKSIKIKVYKPTIITKGFSGNVSITMQRKRTG